MRLIVIGTQRPPGLGAMDYVLLGQVVESHFDNASETWTVTGPGRECANAAVVVDARPSVNPAIASHGVPNYFRIAGPDVHAQTRYVARCLTVMQRSGASRMEAKKTIRARRWGPVASRFYLSGAEPGPDDLYDGPATVTIGEQSVTSRVRLAGHLDAIDGRYHWQGTLFAAPPGIHGNRAGGLTLTIAGRAVSARVVEQTPWGTHMIAGVGEPPFT